MRTAAGRLFSVPCLLLAVAALPVSLGAGCTNTLDVRTELDVHHEEAFAKEGEDLRASLRRDPDGGDAWVTELIPIDDAFDRIGVRYDSDLPIVVEGRVGADQGSLGPWTTLTVTFDEGFAHNAQMEAFSDDGAQGAYDAGVVQLRVSDISRLSFLAISPILLATDDVDTDLDLRDEDPALQALAADGIAITRSAWGARSRSCSSRHTPSRITVHHTATPNNDPMSMPARMRQIQAFHIDNRGWCDIGYHFLVGQDGRVYQGRVENRVGAHAAGANTNNVGVAFIGTFTSGAPSGDMMAAGARIIRAIADTYRITLDRNRVKGHRQVGSTDTTCPGTALYNRLQGLVDLARSSSSLQAPPSSQRGSAGTASCSSATAGRTVNHGDRVQVDYAGCGVDRCGWYTCNDGSWVCDVAPATGSTAYQNDACDAAEEPFTPDTPDDGDDGAGDVDDETAGPEDVVVVASLPATFNGDTSTLRRDSWDRYSCDQGLNEGGSEAVYQVTLPSAGTLHAAVDDVSGDDVDVDVHLLRDADPNTCLARDNVSIDEALAAGTYYVVVDTFTNSAGLDRAGPFTLRLSFDATGGTGPTAPVTDDGDACPAGVTCLTSPNQRVTGTTVGGSDRFDRYSCSTANESGPERIFRVVVEQAGFFTARLAGGASDVDVDVQLLSDLDANACLHRGDATTGAWLAPGTYFVVVDTFTPSSGANLSGAFAVDLHHTPVSQLTGHGMTSTVAQRALNAFDIAWKAGTTTKLAYTIIDFDQRSNNRRLWTVDLATGALLHHLHVSHGIGSNSSSDAARSVRYSNVSGSNQSSVGLSKGAEVYSGRHGRSLRLDGLEPGFNSNMRSRAIVIHAADYATPAFAQQNGYLGRSHGCPAVDPARNNALIDTVKGGGLVFSHASDSTWLAQSRYLR